MEGLYVVLMLVRIIGAIVCSNKARELNRNATTWGFLGFFFPIIAMIWIYCLKPITIWDKD